MAFNGNEGDMIDPKLAQQMIDAYAKGLGPNDTRAGFFGFRKITELLSQGNAVGIRIYLAKDEQGLVTFMLTAVSADEKNLAPIDGSKSAVGTVLDNNYRCPPYCPITD